MDDEVKGKGNSVNYKYRMHDPRIGRFFAVDPLAPQYPHNSPYAFSENEVIDAVELEGLERKRLNNGQWVPTCSSIVKTGTVTLPKAMLQKSTSASVEWEHNINGLTWAANYLRDSYGTVEMKIAHVRYNRTFTNSRSDHGIVEGDNGDEYYQHSSYKRVLFAKYSDEGELKQLTMFEYSGYDGKQKVVSGDMEQGLVLSADPDDFIEGELYEPTITNFDISDPIEALKSLSDYGYSNKQIGLIVDDMINNAQYINEASKQLIEDLRDLGDRLLEEQTDMGSGSADPDPNYDDLEKLLQKKTKKKSSSSD